MEVIRGAILHQIRIFFNIVQKGRGGGGGGKPKKRKDKGWGEGGGGGAPRERRGAAPPHWTHPPYGPKRWRRGASRERVSTPHAVELRDKGVLDPVNTAVVLWGGARPPVADLAPGAGWLVVAGGLTTGRPARRTR